MRIKAHRDEGFTVGDPTIVVLDIMNRIQCLMACSQYSDRGFWTEPKYGVQKE